MAESPSPAKNRVRPLDALRALRSLIRNPDDTSQVFRIIRALSGNAFERQYLRFRATEVGQRVLASDTELIDRLCDREALRALPVESLGHHYLRFVEREQISAEGLRAARDEAQDEPDVVLDAPRRVFGDRLRDMHDLWHVTAGYGRDLLGEASLLAFTYAQTRNRGIGAIVLMAWWRIGRSLPAARETIRDGYQRGKRAAWLPAQDWEALLAMPLEEARKQLGLEEPPRYEELRSQGAPALA